MEKLKIYIDQVDSHIHIRVFFNGGLCGKLTLRVEEFWEFLDEFHFLLSGLFSRGELCIQDMRDYFTIYREDAEKLVKILEVVKNEKVGRRT